MIPVDQRLATSPLLPAAVDVVRGDVTPALPSSLCSCCSDENLQMISEHQWSQAATFTHNKCTQVLLFW